MTLDYAILLTQAWCKEARVPFADAIISSNGDFRGIFGAAEIFYSNDQKMLSVEGLIINEANLYAKRPYFFNKIKRIGERESYTLGEGYFYIEDAPIQRHPPLVVLRKDFHDNAISPQQFVLEVDWLMSWSTYWRLQRTITMSGVSEEELIRQAPGIEAWARKNSPRPW